MKSNHRTPAAGNSRRFCLHLAGLFALLCLPTVRAQEALASDPSPAPLPASMQASAEPASAATPTDTSNPLKWGPVSASPRVSYRFLYGDGIMARPGRKTTSTLQTLTPGLQLGLGEYWAVDYVATLTYYSSKEFSDTVGHKIDLTGGTTYKDWFLYFSQNYNTSSATLLQTGEQTRSSNHTTTFTSSYAVTPVLSWDSSLAQRVMFVEEPNPTTRDWTATEGFNYRYSRQLSLGLSTAVGYMSVDPGADMRYVQPQGQVTWSPLNKLSLSMQGGYETRKFLSGPGGRLTTSDYRGTVVYTPFEYTRLTYLNVRGSAPTYITGQFPKQTRWNIILDQRLLRRFFLHTGYSEEHYTYYDSENPGTILRKDKGYLYNARLTTTVFRRVSLAGYYQFRKLRSSDPQFSFSGSYVGFEVGFRY